MYEITAFLVFSAKHLCRYVKGIWYKCNYSFNYNKCFLKYLYRLSFGISFWYRAQAISHLLQQWNRWILNSPYKNNWILIHTHLNVFKALLAFNGHDWHKYLLIVLDSRLEIIKYNFLWRFDILIKLNIDFLYFFSVEIRGGWNAISTVARNRQMRQICFRL